MLSYAITDRVNFSFESINKDLNRISKVADMILYRDKENPKYDSRAEEFLRVAERFPFKRVLIHNSVDLALEIGYSSIHFSSVNIYRIGEAKKRGLFSIASCHNREEIDLATGLGVDMITLSPLFSTPNKGVIVGERRFREMVKESDVPIIALGGIISEREVDIAKSLGAVGFASIRYFA
jgi:thiamine-phosphate pyrophosphorylase